jgi:hypothetical protein
MAPSNIKSIRIDEELSRVIGKDTNFSNLANQAIKEFINKSVWLPNFEIDKHAGITAEQVLERVKNVRYLRSSDTAVAFTLYPTSEDEIKRNKSIFDYANGSYNSLHDGFVYFNVKFPLDFLLFLKSRSWDAVHKCVIGFLSLLYWEDEDRRHIMETQIEKKTLRAVKKIVDGNAFDELSKIKKTYTKTGGAQLRAQYNNAYFKVAIDLGIDPIVFPYMKRVFAHIQYPIHMSEYIPFVENNFEIKLPAGYMRDIYEDKDDWTSIVVNGNRRDDSLQRSESDSAPWENWLEEFSFYHHLD